jgi:hypothetical protein
MPRNRAVWSAWNYHQSGPRGPACLTADVAYLIGRPEKGPILTSLNPYDTPDPKQTQGVFPYQHPIFDTNTIAAQNAVRSIQGQQNVWFAGAWLGSGFHEDGFTSGVKAAQMMCPELVLPFDLQGGGTDNFHKKSWSQSLMTLLRFLIRSGVLLVTWIKQLYPVVQTVKGIKGTKTL